MWGWELGRESRRQRSHTAYLHPNHGVNEEEHHYQQGHVGQGLGGSTRDCEASGDGWPDAFPGHCTCYRQAAAWLGGISKNPTKVLGTWEKALTPHLA